MRSMPRFVLLRHTLPDNSSLATHWDFMLEHDGALRTWALDAEPVDGLEISALQLADHRLAYLEYEGEVSGGRGWVTRLDRGSYSLTGEDSASLRVELCGERLMGVATLTRLADDQRWRVVFASDAASSPPVF